MALNKTALAEAINTAFKAQTWADTANQFADAVDGFILSGEADLSIVATVYPPGGGSYTQSDNGTGTITTTAKAGLISAGISAFASTLWSTVSGILCPSINTLLGSATVATSVNNILVGSGTGTIATSGYSTLYSAFNMAFTTTSSTTTWEIIANDLANAVDVFVRAAVVSSPGMTGISPPSSWTGTGTGGII